MAYLKAPTMKEGWFGFAIAACNTGGYLLASFPPIIIDPLLPHHVGVGARGYPYDWLIWPIASLLFITTLGLMCANTASFWRLAAAIVPLVVCCSASLFILRPPFPHANVLFLGTVWTSLTALWVMIRYNLFQDDPSLLIGVDKEACLRFITEQLEFSRLLLLGLIAGFAAIFVTAINASLAQNRTILTLPNGPAETNAVAYELFRLNMNTFIGYTGISLLFLFGPVLELVKRRRGFLLLFLQIRGPKRPGDGG